MGLEARRGYEGSEGDVKLSDTDILILRDLTVYGNTIMYPPHQVEALHRRISVEARRVEQERLSEQRRLDDLKKL